LPAKTATVIAEVSANHLGNLDRLLKLVDASHDAGADFVKLQHFRPETITARGISPDLSVSGGTAWDGQSLWDLYEEAMMPWEWTADIASYCAERKIKWFSTPFDESAVDFLESFNPPQYKVASFELVDLPLIRYIAQTGKPMILSTGMATPEEIDQAVEAAASSGASAISLLRTNSAYPAPLAEMRLSAIPTMAERWGLEVGLSDHTLGSEAAVVARALGATIFEKHLTLRRYDGGPDASFSSEPNELRDYIEKIRQTETIMGDPILGPSEHEEASLHFRPSLRAISDIPVGGVVSSDNVRSLRPGGGLPPDRISSVIGRRTVKQLLSGDALTESHLEPQRSPQI